MTAEEKYYTQSVYMVKIQLAYSSGGDEFIFSFFVELVNLKHYFRMQFKNSAWNFHSVNKTTLKQIY